MPRSKAKSAPIRRDILIENGRIAALAAPGELDKAERKIVFLEEEEKQHG